MAVLRCEDFGRCYSVGAARCATIAHTRFFAPTPASRGVHPRSRPGRSPGAGQATPGPTGQAKTNKYKKVILKIDSVRAPAKIHHYNLAMWGPKGLNHRILQYIGIEHPSSALAGAVIPVWTAFLVFLPPWGKRGTGLMGSSNLALQTHVLHMCGWVPQMVSLVRPTPDK